MEFTAPIQQKRKPADYNFSEIDIKKFGKDSGLVSSHIAAAKKAGVTKFYDGRVTHTGNTNLMFNPLTGVYTHKTGKLVKNVLHKLRQKKG